MTSASASSQFKEQKVREFRRGPFSIVFVDRAADRALADGILNMLKAAQTGEEKNCGEVRVILGDDLMLKRLNGQFRGLDEPTDVLSFDLSDGELTLDGEIYISMDQASVQAVSAKCDLNLEVLRLAAHGFLHLCGYDHPDDISLERMLMLGEKYISNLS